MSESTQTEEPNNVVGLEKRLAIIRYCVAYDDNLLKTSQKLAPHEFKCGPPELK